jgi:hypothetical protein
MDCLEGYSPFGSFLSSMILIYSSRMMGFGFGVGRGSKGGNESVATPIKNGSHVVHELTFFNTEWPTTST